MPSPYVLLFAFLFVWPLLLMAITWIIGKAEAFAKPTPVDPTMAMWLEGIEAGGTWEKDEANGVWKCMLDDSIIGMFPIRTKP